MNNLDRINKIFNKWQDYVKEVNKNKDKVPEKEVREKLKAAMIRIFDLFSQYEEEDFMPEEDPRDYLIKNVGINRVDKQNDNSKTTTSKTTTSKTKNSKKPSKKN